MTEKSDYELLHGNSDEFGELHKKYHRGVQAFLRLNRLVRNPSDMPDVEQLVWLRVYEKRDKYDSYWGFSKWLLRLTLFVAFNYKRSQQILTLFTNHTGFVDIIDHRGVRDVLLLAEIQEVVRDAVANLSEDEREAIDLIYLQQAEKVQGPHRNGYRRGRKHLRSILRGFYHEI